MFRASTQPTIALPDLIGLPVAGAGCLLNTAQLLALGSLLLRTRPQDAQAVCFLSSSLAALTGPNGQGTQRVVSLQGDGYDDPFLVVASRHGILALLTIAVPGSNGSADSYQARISTDPGVVDRAALVLAQLDDAPYNFDAAYDAESQRGFVAAIVAAIVGEPLLAQADLAALLPDETRWLAMARAISSSHEPAGWLALAPIRQALQEWGCTRALLGQLDAFNQQVVVLAAEGAPAPQSLGVAGWGLGGVARTLTPNPQTTNDAAGWLGGVTVLAAPLSRDGRVWGVLLASAARPFSGAARAGLGGLAMLLAQQLTSDSRAQPARPPASQPLPASPAPPRNGTLVPPPAPPAHQVAAPAALQPEPSQQQGTFGRAATGSRHGLLPLLAHLAEAVVAVDAQGRLTACSPATEPLLGLTRSHVGQALISGPAACLAPLLTSALLGDATGPQTLLLPNGAEVPVAPVALDGGAWLFVLKAAPPAVAPPSRQPPLAVTTISDSDRIERFLTTFSNGIRAPLRSLRELITQVSSVGGLSEQQGRLVGQVIKQHSEIMMLVNDLFALGQMRLQSPENRMPLRIDLLVDAAIGTQYAEYGRRGQQVTTTIAPNLPLVPGSEEGLWRAVSALVDNAIKYSPNGAALSVDVREQGGEVVVTIIDTGLGLGAEELEQAFDPFFRAHSAEQLDVPGRGLGLAIAKAVIEQHGGRLWATSILGLGSTFAFSLPHQ